MLSSLIVHQVSSQSLTVGETNAAEHWLTAMMASIEDGRSDMIALRNHFCGRGSNPVQHRTCTRHDLLIIVTVLLAESSSSSSAVDAAGNSFLVYGSRRSPSTLTAPVTLLLVSCHPFCLICDALQTTAGERPSLSVINLCYFLASCNLHCIPGSRQQ